MAVASLHDAEQAQWLKRAVEQEWSSGQLNAAIKQKQPRLILPGEVTQTGLVLPKGMAFDVWLECGRVLVRAETSTQWWLGDWWAYGEHEYGDRSNACG
jgi:hypothetical protein